MMKCTASINGRKILIIGLSHGNLDRLRADGLNGAAVIRGDDMNIPIDIWITAAETEQVLMEEFGKHIGPDTKVHISDKLKS